MRKEITFDRFIRGALVAAAILAVFWFVKELSSVLLPFFIAWFLAYLLYPIVKFVQYKLHVPTRALSIIVTLIFVTAIIGGVTYLIIPPMIEQFDKLGSIFTRYIQQTAHTNNIGEMVRDWIAQNKESIASFFRSKDFTETVKTTMPKVFSMLGQTASIVISIVASCITLLYMFFILLDYEFLTENWIRIFPKKVRPYVVLLGDILFIAFAVYITYTGFFYSMEQIQFDMRSAALKIPYQYIYMSTVVGFGLATIREIQTIIYRVKCLKNGEEYDG